VVVVISSHSSHDEELSRSPPPPAAEGSSKTPAKKWVGWEEDVVLDKNGNRLVCYYFRCTRPRDSDFDGKVERDPAEIGKFWGVGTMEYSEHPKFLRPSRRRRQPSRRGRRGL
jgi:hypothetical protein